jgi:transposase
MKTRITKHYSPEVRERAVRMISEHQGEYASEWAAIQSISAKIGCTAETLRRWLRESQKATGAATKLGGSDPERIRALEREVRELRQANEILRKASAYFAQAELDYPQGTSARPSDESVH